MGNAAAASQKSFRKSTEPSIVFSSNNTLVDENNTTNNAPPDPEQIISLMFPVYYCTGELTKEEHTIVYKSWEMILNHTAPAFLAERAKPQFPFGSCTIYFTHTYYKRLFDIHPCAKGMFKDVQAQGRALIQMITTIFTYPDDPIRYEQIVTHLTHVHNRRGVKAAEYGVAGEVLFWTLRHCLGESIYTPALHKLWAMLFSKVLSIMVPLAVRYEMSDGASIERRFVINSIPLSDRENAALRKAEDYMNQVHATQSEENIRPTVRIN